MDFEFLIGRMDRQFHWLVGLLFSVLLTSLAGLGTSLFTLLAER